MIDLRDVISIYIPVAFERDDAYTGICDDRRDGAHPGSCHVYANEYGIHAYASFLGKVYDEQKRVTTTWLSTHSADKQIRSQGDSKCLWPLAKYDACEYMWYGMYLNVLAFLSPQKIGILRLIHLPSGAQMINFSLQPALAVRLLEDYNQNYRESKEEARAESEKIQPEKQSEITHLQLSM